MKGGGEAFSAQGVAWFLYGAVASAGLLAGGAWAGLGIGGALALALWSGLEGRVWPVPGGRIFAVVVVFLLAASSSALFSPYPQEAWYGVAKLASVLVPLSFLFAPVLWKQASFSKRQIWGLALALGIGFLLYNAVLLFMIAFCDLSDGKASKINRGFSYGLLLLWPVLGAVWDLRKEEKTGGTAIALLLGGVMLGLMITHSRASQMAMTLAVSVFFFARFWPRLAAWGMGTAGVLALAWPFVIPSLFEKWPQIIARLPSSWGHRFEIWDYLSYKVAQRPWLGWGIGQTHHLEWSQPHGELYRYMTVPASHPHNAVIQAWVELGVLGAIAYLLLLFIALYGVSRLEPRRRPYALAAVVFAFGLLMTAYNFWTDSLWAAMALSAAAFVFTGGVRSDVLREEGVTY